MEDIELGFRLSRHGLKVVYARSAQSFMLRAVTFDEFARRCVKRGRALWLFNQRHDDPAVERYCRVAEALERWPRLAPSLDEKVERVRELEHRHAEDEELADEDLDELQRALLAGPSTPCSARDRGGGRGGCRAGPRTRTIPTDELGARNELPDPVFIIGSPRSGTSILAWSLAQHSELVTEPESDIFYYLLKDGHLERAFETSVARTDGSWLGNHGIDLEQYLEHVGIGLNALLTATTNGRRWVDQTPANTLVVDRLAEMFPGARFLHILRDGRRVVHSMVNFHRTFADPETAERMRSAGRLPPWTTDFHDACRTWTRFVRIATDFCRGILSGR